VSTEEALQLILGRFDGLEARLDRVEARLDRVEARLDRVEARLDHMEGQLSEHDRRFDRIEETLRLHDARFDRVDEALARVDARFNRVDDAFDRVMKYFLDLRTEMIMRLDTLDSRYGILLANLAGIEPRLNGLNKAVSDFGEIATRIIAEQWKRREESVDLATRLSKLEEREVA
jgi:chromosome segregation ATPase